MCAFYSEFVAWLDAFRSGSGGSKVGGGSTHGSMESSSDSPVYPSARALADRQYISMDADG
ncbi:MAG: hypothetical protein WD000_02745 [Thermodesulfobacteriota bacterium]